ncbi:MULTISPECIES: hypothetical protein [Marinobacter]|uniref:Response regulatory domain-containing protein n=1 Tax=Marinobacter metalliresistant TaxID=2961995 RepID=A0ABZ2VYU8_9GAMM|nr:hypothetical protein [Marinobacter sp. Arc7-DN-1]
MNPIPQPLTNKPPRTPSPLVAVMVDQKTGLSFLEQLAGYSCIEPDLQALRTTPFTLAIFDIATLAKCEDEVRGIRHSARPFPVPILLLVSDDDLPQAGHFIGDLADDVIRVPVSAVELTARIECLIRLTRLAGGCRPNTEPVTGEPAGDSRVLQALIACNDRVIHACNEQEILSDVCKSLTREGGYPFAWVGTTHGERGGTIKPVAVSGVVLSQQGASAVGALDTRPMEHTFGSGRRFLKTPNADAG